MVKLNCRKRSVFVILSLLCLIFIITRHSHGVSQIQILNVKQTNNPNMKDYGPLFDLLKQTKPSIDPLKKYKTDQKIYHAGADSPPEHVFSKDYLYSFLDVSTKEIENLSKVHSEFVTSISISSPISGALYDLVTRGASGKGIVYVGGDRYTWLVLLSMHNLRSLKTTLPIEIIIPTRKEYEADFCEKVAPDYDAKCIVLEDELGEKTMNEFNIRGYQYKVLALLISSFDDILYLDADNMPTRSLNSLLTSYPFVRTGLVTWPDFWRRATSPDYYKIAGFEISNERVRGDLSILDLNEVPFHDLKGTLPDPTTESGMLMFSKSLHWKSLLLSLYYNIYGPDYYYPLFSQGSDGEGDKETFLAAAACLDEPYYQVNTNLGAVGYFEDGEFHGTGMAQHDPVQDYLIYLKKKRDEQQIEISTSSISSGKERFSKRHYEEMNTDQKLVENKNTMFGSLIEYFQTLIPQDITIGLITESESNYKTMDEKEQSPPLKNKNLKHKREEDNDIKSGVMFIHANFPKLNPVRLFNDKVIISENGERRRIYGTGMRFIVGYDFELITWQNIKYLICDYAKDFKFSTFEEQNISTKDVCSIATDHVEYLERTSKDME